MSKGRNIIIIIIIIIIIVIIIIINFIRVSKRSCAS